MCIRNQTGPQRSVGWGGRGTALGKGRQVRQERSSTGTTPCCSVVSQLLKLGNGLLESGRHYLAASRAFIVGIGDLAHLGPPEPMMAVCGGSRPGCGGVWDVEETLGKAREESVWGLPVPGLGVGGPDCPCLVLSFCIFLPRSVWTNSLRA